MLKTPEEIEMLFNEKVQMIEQTTGKSVYYHFLMQVGPKDAETIMKQMQAFFTSGYLEARKDILGT